jgi:hypothetical protein
VLSGGEPQNKQLPLLKKPDAGFYTAVVDINEILEM